MKTIQLGNSGLEVSAISLGCMRISEMSAGEVGSLIQCCIEQGIQFFDHADIYAQGRSEEIFAKGLKEAGIARHNLFLQSKCGIQSGSYNFSKSYIIESANAILKRLQTDYLDVLLLHRPDTLMEPEEVAEAFDTLYAAGKVRYFGVSNQNGAQMQLTAQYMKQPLVANQLQFSCAHTGMIDAGFHVNMKDEASLNHDSNTLEYCRLHHITIQTWSSLQYGFFEGTFLGNQSYTQLNQVLDRIAEETDTDKAAVAIAWILRHPANMQVVVGTTKEERIKQIARASQIQLTREQWYEIYRAAGNMLP